MCNGGRGTNLHDLIFILLLYRWAIVEEPTLLVNVGTSEQHDPRPILVFGGQTNFVKYRRFTLMGRVTFSLIEDFRTYISRQDVVVLSTCTIR